MAGAESGVPSGSESIAASELKNKENTRTEVSGAVKGAFKAWTEFTQTTRAANPTSPVTEDENNFRICKGKLQR
jgi:hypothetical protein